MESNISNSDIKPCYIRLLPQEQWADAAKLAAKINPVNTPALHQFSQAIPDGIMPALHLAVITTKYWGAAGVHLTVGFLDDTEQDLKDRIISHMNAWSEYANVSFTESDDDPQVRISRTAGSGYWSYLGTDVKLIPKDQPTMNLDSFSMQTAESEFHRVVRHETGHTLGFPHEHMREEIVDKIDRDKAIAYFGHTQGWSEQEVIDQVLTPIDALTVSATAHADENSIMCYWLPGQIMTNLIPVPGGIDIDQEDINFVGLIYPKSLITK